VPRDWIEEKVVSSAEDLLSKFADRKGVVRKLNENLRRKWETSKGVDPRAEEKIRSVEGKIENIRRAIEDGLADAS
jgi:hypothetical protein